MRLEAEKLLLADQRRLLLLPRRWSRRQHTAETMARAETVTGAFVDEDVLFVDCVMDTRQTSRQSFFEDAVGSNAEVSFQELLEREETKDDGGWCTRAALSLFAASLSLHGGQTSPTMRWAPFQSST